jgi:hypothetical protein
MRKTIFPWLGSEFVSLSAEAQAGASAGEQARDVFDRFAAELSGEGLSLADTVRTRLWARDRESRDGGSRQRVAVLAGDARSASSSYIALWRTSSRAPTWRWTCWRCAPRVRTAPRR